LTSSSFAASSASFHQPSARTEPTPPSQLTTQIPATNMPSGQRRTLLKLNRCTPLVGKSVTRRLTLLRQVFRPMESYSVSRTCEIPMVPEHFRLRISR
jgi:hypothetical protein